MSEDPRGHALTLIVALTRKESNDLFLAGDSMISWPEEGLIETGHALFSRTSMFVSELAASPGGLTLLYEARGQADRSAKLLSIQFERIGITRED